MMSPNLIRFANSYPNEAPLFSEAGARAGNQHDPQCERPYREMLLRTACSDPMAFSLEQHEYQPQLSGIPQLTANLPCFESFGDKAAVRR